jgi:ABC-type sugar transport system ATPase subunit
MGYVPADRHRFGLVLPMTLSENTALGYHLTPPNAGWFNLRRDYMRTNAQTLVKNFDIRTPGVGVLTEQLSGGNQQKVILGKWVASKPGIIIFDEPTKGIDVGTKAEIYKLLRKLASEKIGVIMVSSEMPELLAVCDRIIVLANGKISGEFKGLEATEEELFKAAAIQGETQK